MRIKSVALVGFALLCSNLADAQRVHTEEKFSFTAHAAMSEVGPLFGASRERVWSPGWDPEFVHPVAEADQLGMVFRVKRDGVESTWVNTAFDLTKGVVQYVYVIPAALVTVITLKLTPHGATTEVEVQYDRTALSGAADSEVGRMAEHDRAAGPEWAKQINEYLSKSAAVPVTGGH